MRTLPTLLTTILACTSLFGSLKPTPAPPSPEATQELIAAGVSAARHVDGFLKSFDSLVLNHRQRVNALATELKACKADPSRPLGVLRFRLEGKKSSVHTFSLVVVQVDHLAISLGLRDFALEDDPETSQKKKKKVDEYRKVLDEYITFWVKYTQENHDKIVKETEDFLKK